MAIVTFPLSGQAVETLAKAPGIFIGVAIVVVWVLSLARRSGAMATP